MDKEYEQKYHSIEEYNWWFKARRHTILSLIKKLPKDARIIDIGCGGGVLLKALKTEGFSNLTGIDFSPEAIEKCKKNGLADCYIMDAHYPDFKDETFDLIISSDCLEHLKDDEVALKGWCRILKKGGQAIIFVPALMSLWSEHDVTNHHFRRYKEKELIDKSKTAGFQILKSSYWNGLLFFPVFLYRKYVNIINARSGKVRDNLGNVNPILNNLLKSWLSIENIFFNSTGLPIGTSVMVILEK